MWLADAEKDCLPNFANQYLGKFNSFVWNWYVLQRSCKYVIILSKFSDKHYVPILHLLIIFICQVAGDSWSMSKDRF